MEQLLEQLKSYFSVVLADDEVYPCIAKVYRKAFDAFKAEGFTDEQAAKFTIATVMKPQ